MAYLRVPKTSLEFTHLRRCSQDPHVFMPTALVTFLTRSPAPIRLMGSGTTTGLGVLFKPLWMQVMSPMFGP